MVPAVQVEQVVRAVMVARLVHDPAVVEAAVGHILQKILLMEVLVEEDTALLLVLRLLVLRDREAAALAVMEGTLE